MGFGLENATAIFQRMLKKAFFLYRDFSRTYVSDTAIFKKGLKSHPIHLDIKLSKL